jgi:TolB protein
MKYVLWFWISLSLAGSGSGCGGRDSGGSPSAAEETALEDSTWITIADANLEAAVRQALKKPTGPLTEAEAAPLTTLEAQGRGIKELKGIERLINLVVLDLSDNQVQDLSPLTRLTQLTFLDLSGNQVKDLSALSGLGRLEILVLDANQVHDLSPLSRLTQLKSLELSGNPLDEASLNVHLPALKSRGVKVTFQAYEGNENTSPLEREISSLAFVGVHSGVRQDIFLLKTDGSAPVNLTDHLHPAKYRDLSWSPDGSKIALVSNQEEGNLFDLYALEADGNNLVRLTQELGPRPKYSDPSWSPDGSRIAFLGALHQYSEIFVMGTDGSPPTDLTHIATEGVYHTKPDWSPDGTQVIFERYRVDLNWDYLYKALYKMNADGSGLVKLGDGWSPSWSPDGAKVLFVSDRSGDSEIYLTDTQGNSTINLTHHPASDRGPAWSPDGRRIAFESDREGSFEVYVMNADGSAPFRLTHFSVGDFAATPLWSPDGTWISFVYDRDLYLVDTSDLVDTGDRELVNLTNHDPPLVIGFDYAWRPR